MKALPKRKGNTASASPTWTDPPCLNESPSQKEGKSGQSNPHPLNALLASMKALPKRKGNPDLLDQRTFTSAPQ